MPGDERQSSVEGRAEARLGQVLRDKYRLDRVLGIGGMATVYAATHRNSKQFAIKVLHPELSMVASTRARFLREGYVANQVKHPGAVAVLDEDVAEDGSAFIVMELLEGASLEELRVDGARRLPVALVVSLGDALLDVLIAAHARGIVHRDLKPANLFLTTDGALKVLDFGIARLRDEGGAMTTLPGSVLGTPAFMAPEQLTGKGADVDAQTDLWAVGATLFALLAGALVHEGENALQFIASAATRPARRLSSVANEVPKPIADVIDRALRFDKSGRWESAEAMRAALATACMEATGAGVAPLPKGFTRSVGPVSAKAVTDVVSGRSDPAAFVPTLEAPSGLGRETLTTGAAVARARSERSPRRARSGAVGRVVRGLLACAVVGGGVGTYRALRAPHVRYCAFVDDTGDGPRCALEITPADVLARGSTWTTKVTEIGGRAVSLEEVNFGGPASVFSWMDDQATRAEVVRGEHGEVTDVVWRSRLGNIERHEKWFDGGTRIDLVEEDGVTPRAYHHNAWQLPESSVTTIRRDLDAKGRVTRERYFAPAGRPASDLKGAYGYEYVYGKTIGVPIRKTVLGADGAKAAQSDGKCVEEVADDGVPGGSDTRYFDCNGKAVTVNGVHREHVEQGSAHQHTSERSFGLHEEPVCDTELGAHETRFEWNPVTRTSTTGWYDEAGHAHPAKGEIDAAIRDTFDERGRMVLFENLDAEGNRMYRKQWSAADRFVWNDRDELTLIERLDVAGASMQSGGWAKQAADYDVHGLTTEIRNYDESGKPTPTVMSGATIHMTLDARGFPVIVSQLDGEGHPFARVDGAATTQYRYDRLRHVVERTELGPDGRPCIIDEGFAIKRATYDANGDLLTETYLDTTGAPTIFKEEYATRRITVDAVGLPASEEYLDAHGERVLRKAGYAVVRFVRDRNGDVIEEATFGKRDEAVVRDDGYAKKTTTYDGQRRPIEIALFDAKGAPVVGSDGWAIEHDTFDERGLLVRTDYEGADRRPVLAKSGSASLVKAYDGRGNVIEETTLGIDGKPVATPSGYAMKKSAYDERDQLVDEALFGADGMPASGKDKWANRRLRYDQRGSLIEEAFFDVAHHPTTPKDAAFASIASHFDKRLRLVETAYFDAGGAPSKGPDGVAAVRYERDANGRAVATTYVDGLGNPVASSEGKVGVHTRYDDAGRVTEELFTDAAGAPLAAKDGCAGHRTKYDRLGRKVEETCVDVKDGLALSTEGWAIRRMLRDGRGNAVDVSTYGPDGSLHATKDGIARTKSQFDERNLLLETAFFDAADRPTRDKHGAYGAKYSYDESGKKTGETPVDAQGNATSKAPSDKGTGAQGQSPP